MDFDDLDCESHFRGCDLCICELIKEGWGPMKIKRELGNSESRIRRVYAQMRELSSDEYSLGA